MQRARLDLKMSTQYDAWTNGPWMKCVCVCVWENNSYLKFLNCPMLNVQQVRKSPQPSLCWCSCHGFHEHLWILSLKLSMPPKCLVITSSANEAYPVYPAYPHIWRLLHLLRVGPKLMVCAKLLTLNGAQDNSYLQPQWLIPLVDPMNETTRALEDKHRSSYNHLIPRYPTWPTTANQNGFAVVIIHSSYIDHPLIIIHEIPLESQRDFPKPMEHQASIEWWSSSVPSSMDSTHPRPSPPHSLPAQKAGIRKWPICIFWIYTYRLYRLFFAYNHILYECILSYTRTYIYIDILIMILILWWNDACIWNLPTERSDFASHANQKRPWLDPKNKWWPGMSPIPMLEKIMFSMAWHWNSHFTTHPVLLRAWDSSCSGHRVAPIPSSFGIRQRRITSATSKCSELGIDINCGFHTRPQTIKSHRSSKIWAGNIAIHCNLLQCVLDIV